MKRLRFLILFAALTMLLGSLLPQKAKAATARSGKLGSNLTYSLSSIGTLTISGTGAMTNNDTPWYDRDWSDEISSVYIEDGVTSIGNSAFSYCTNLGYVSLAASVTTIGNYAFYNCTSLDFISLPTNLTQIGLSAFEGSGLTTVYIGTKVTSIGKNAFYNCQALSSISVYSTNTVYSASGGVLFNKDKTTLIAAPGGLTGHYSMPSTVTTINDNAFYNCKKMTGITFSSKVSKIGDYTFYGSGLTEVTIPGHIDSIGRYAFSGSALTSLTVENGVTTIQNYAFSNCTNLATVDIANTVVNLGTNLFTNTAYWTNLPDGPVYMGGVLYGSKGSCPANLTVKEGTVSIAKDALKSQSSLVSVTLPEGLQSIGGYAFSNCSNLTTINMPSTVTQLGEYAFYGCAKLTDITISEGVTYLPNYLFTNCSGLTKVTVPGSVTEIGSYAFSKCTALSELTLSEGLKTIGSYAFDQCKAIKNLRIPDSVTTLDAYAFPSCAFSYIYMGSSLQSVGREAFSRLDLNATPTVEIGDLNNWLNIQFVTDGSNPMCGGPLYIQGQPVTSITIPDTVTKINDYVLKGCPATVTEITLHDQITSIGAGAFEKCTGLTSFVIPSQVETIGTYAFYECTGLRSLIMSDGITTIDSYAFAYCDALTSITVPDSVTTIGAGAFFNCTKLQSLQLPKNLTVLSTSLIERDPLITQLVVPENVSKIEAYALDSQNLTVISLPASITTFNINQNTPALSHIYYAGTESQWNSFSKPSAFSNITVHYNTADIQLAQEETCSFNSNCCLLCGESVSTIAKETSSHQFVSGACTLCGVDEALQYTIRTGGNGIEITGYTGSATKLVIPSTIENIPVKSIAAIHSATLSEIVVPDSVVQIHGGAFSGCSNLTHITLPFVGAQRIGANEYGYKYPLGYIFGTSSYTNATSRSQNYSYYLSYNSSSSYTSTYYYFPSSLRSVTITGGSLNYGAFYDCDMLEEIILTNNVSAVGEQAFYDCSKLQRIVLPEGITKINSYAFYSCRALKEIVIPEGITTINSYAFYNCSSLAHIVLPRSLQQVDTYAFYYCNKLTKVCYTGTQVDKGMMYIYSSGNTKLTGSTWTYEATNAKVLPQESCTAVNYICSHCQYIVWTEPKATATHAFAAATCTAPKTCTICGATEGLALGHSGDQWVETVAPTCTEPGSQTRVCTVCGETETAVLEPTGHSYQDVVTAPTCIDKGYTTKTCSVCSHTIVTDHVDATGHNFSAWLQTKASTCTEEGLYTRTCPKCSTSEEYPIQALGHNIKYISNNDATAEQNGTKTGSCSRCGYTETVTEEGSQLIYVTGGTWGTNVTWSIYGKVLTISGTGVPDEARGGYDYPWGDYCASITKIVVEPGITGISNHLFEYCENATTIILPETITHIILNAFNDCQSLNNLLIPASVTAITGTSNTGYPAFIRCYSLTDVYYLGTAEEWNEITNNKYITSADSTMTRHMLQRYESQATCTEPGVQPYYRFDNTTVYAMLFNESKQPIAQPEFAPPLGHDFTNQVVDATCTTDGYITKTCGVCGHIETEIIPSQGHQNEAVITLPTCTEGGYTTLTCTGCGISVIIDPTSAIGHNWKDATCVLPSTCDRCNATQGEPLDHNWKDVTCTEPSTCNRCGETQGEPLGHSWKDATCLEAKTCDRCGTTEGDPLGHDWLDATCTEPSTCDRCGETQGEPLGHSWKDATCLEAKTCDRCGITEGDPLGHDWNAATCILPSTCSRCGETRGEPLGHSGPWFDLIPATCEEDGIKARICRTCGDTESGLLPAKGHTYGELVMPPTCTEQGYTAKGCFACGQLEYSDYIPATGHTWSGWVQTAVPSCTATGTKMRFCYCGTRETEHLPQLSHNYENEVCTGCGDNQYLRLNLVEDTQVDLTLEKDLYIDLASCDLSGIITANGHRIYVMDSATDDFTCENVGYFTCVDENGDPIEPERVYTIGEKQYMAICTEDRYSFHRFYVGVTHMSLESEVVGLGYKSAVFGDEMVFAQLDADNTFTFRVQLEGYQPVYRTFSREELSTGAPIALRIRNYDVENYGEHNLYAQVSITLADGTVIETEPVSLTFRWLAEEVDKNYTDYTPEQLAFFKAILETFDIVRKWDLPNLMEA